MPVDPRSSSNYWLMDEVIELKDFIDPQETTLYNQLEENWEELEDILLLCFGGLITYFK